VSPRELIHLHVGDDVICQLDGWFAAVEAQYSGELPLDLICVDCLKGASQLSAEAKRRRAEAVRAKANGRRHRRHIAGQTELYIPSGRGGHADHSD